MERTLILLKPDTIQRGLIGEVTVRLESRGLKIVALKMMTVNDDLANRHYKDHIGKPFFSGLVNFITSGPIVAMVLEGESAVEITRNTIGSTNPKEATMGTIRGDLGMNIGQNLIHASDSLITSEREISLFFAQDEIMNYTRDIDKWITAS